MGPLGWALVGSSSNLRFLSAEGQKNRQKNRGFLLPRRFQLSADPVSHQRGERQGGRWRNFGVATGTSLNLTKIPCQICRS